MRFQRETIWVCFPRPVRQRQKDRVVGCHAFEKHQSRYVLLMARLLFQLRLKKVTTSRLILKKDIGSR